MGELLAAMETGQGRDSGDYCVAVVAGVATLGLGCCFHSCFNSKMVVVSTVRGVRG